MQIMHEEQEDALLLGARLLLYLANKTAGTGNIEQAKSLENRAIRQWEILFALRRERRLTAIRKLQELYEQ